MFRSPDGKFISIMVMPYQWDRILEAINMPELARHPRFKGTRERRENWEALKKVIEQWMSGFKSWEEILDALAEARVPCAPILELDEVIVHPHMTERGTIRYVSDPDLAVSQPRSTGPFLGVRTEPETESATAEQRQRCNPVRSARNGSRRDRRSV